MLFGVNTFNIHSDYFRKQAAQLAYVISLGALNAIDDSRLLLAHSRHYPAYSPGLWLRFVTPLQTSGIHGICIHLV